MSHSGVLAGLYAGNFAVEISTDATTWTAVSNATVKVDDVELNRPSGEAYVGGSSDHATITVGKREPVELTLTFLYNEDTGSAANTIVDRFQSATPTLGVRWSPRGLVGSARAYGTSNDGGTSFGVGVITNVTLSALDPSDADPYVAMVTVRTPSLRQYTLGSSPTNLNPAS
jgi:hypothetical protein